MLEVLVGDGIATNEAAASHVFHEMRRDDDLKDGNVVLRSRAAT